MGGDLVLTQYLNIHISHWVFTFYVLHAGKHVHFFRPRGSDTLAQEWQSAFSHDFIHPFVGSETNSPKIGRGSPEIKQYDRFFMRWTWSFNRDFLKKFRPGCLIEYDA